MGPGYVAIIYVCGVYLGVFLGVIYYKQTIPVNPFTTMYVTVIIAFNVKMLGAGIAYCGLIAKVPLYLMMALITSLTCTIDVIDD